MLHGALADPPPCQVSTLNPKSRSGAAQGALAALGGREGVVNVAPSLISLAGAVVNVVPGKACKSVKVDPDLIKVHRGHTSAPGLCMRVTVHSYLAFDDQL